jgi:hypothetical protein
MRFDVYGVMAKFLRSHMGVDHVAFLCRPHHIFVDSVRDSHPRAYWALVKTLATGFHSGAARNPLSSWGQQ